MVAKKYELTPAHRAELGPWADRWIRNAMSTAPMSEADREACRVSVRELYRAAGLPPPPDHRIVFVPSPFVLRFAGGFAAAIWHVRKTDATSDATYAATDAATYAATSAATRAATRAATSDATSDATLDATYRQWYTGVGDMPRLARVLGGAAAGLLLSCAANAYRMWDGGNQWSAWPAFLSFFRHVAKIAIDYSKWKHYEPLAVLAGPRIMHPDFCMISERPERLTVDKQNRPHSVDGPFCRWRDGTALYAVHGVRVPAFVIERPETITVEDIESEGNAEVRRVMVDRYGLARYVRDARFEVLDADTDPLGQSRRLLRKDRLTVVELTNSTEDGDGTRRVYHIPVHPELRPLLPNGELGEPQRLTALAAVASTYWMRAEEYRLQVET